MNIRSKVLCLFVLSGLMGLCSCSQNGAGSGSKAEPGPSLALLQTDDVNRVLALDGKSVEDVVETLGDIQAAHPSLDSKSLARQFDQVVSIRCEDNRCEISRKGGV